jgi:SAM-dependent methyltransferase
LRNYWELYRSYQGGQEETADRYYRKFVKARATFERELGRSVEGCGILEIGSGQRFTYTLLFGAVGARAVGIDTDYAAKRASIEEFVTIWRQNGIERATKTIARKALFDRAYYRAIERRMGCQLPLQDVDLRVMDACALELPDESFDGVFSTNVFEHIHDVEMATKEVARVLRPGGVAIIGICLYCGISGGHHVEWSYPDENDGPREVPAWDHLRENRFPVAMYLNGVRECDYIAAFDKYLEIVALEPHYQGERYLTDEIKGELSDYSREELLTDSLQAVLMKPFGRREG